MVSVAMACTCHIFFLFKLWLQSFSKCILKCFCVFLSVFWWVTEKLDVNDTHSASWVTINVLQFFPVRSTLQSAETRNSREPILPVQSHQGPHLSGVGMEDLPGIREVYTCSKRIRIYRQRPQSRTCGLPGQDGNILPGRNTEVSVLTVQWWPRTDSTGQVGDKHRSTSTTSVQSVESSCHCHRLVTDW